MSYPSTVATNVKCGKITVAENISRTNEFGVYGIYRKLSECSTDIVHNQDSIAPTKVPNEKSSPRKWIIVFVCFFVQWMAAGFTYSMSVLYVPFLDTYDKSKAETSLIQSVFIGTFNISGFMNGLLITKVGTRIAGMIGGILAFIGVSVSFFANGIPFLLVSLGLIGGIGTSIGYISSATCVGYHFQGNNKMLALAFISFGSGVGTTVLPYVLEAFLEEYGLKGCLLLSGGILANIIPCAAMYIQPSHKLRSGYTVKMTSVERTNTIDAICNETKHEKTKSQTKCHSKMMLQLKELKGNSVFIVYVIGMTIAIPIFVAFVTIITDFLQNSQGFDRNTTVLIFFMMNLSSTISRLIPGTIKKCAPRVSVILIQIMQTAVGAIIFALFPFAMTYTHHLILVLTFGFMSGGTMTSLSVVTMNLVGEKNYATAFGIVLGITGVGITVAVPISGYMVDVTGSYSLVFYTSTSGMCLSVFILSLAYAMRICKTKKLDGT